MFKDETEFPQIMRLSPYLVAHHDFRRYEDTISAIMG